MKDKDYRLHILSTKLNRPPAAPDIYPRSRLIKMIDESRNLPLFMISAPAGYGKSTLASIWLEASDCPNAWLSLEEQDNDPRLFLTCFLAAIQSVFPKVGKKTRALLETSKLPPRPILTQSLINDLNELDQDLILVLDDYHLISNKEVHDVLVEILRYPPRMLHLVLLTRRDPPLPISTLRGRGQMMEITVSELRFTVEETMSFFQLVLHMAVDSTTVDLLEKKTEGWITGLRLAALAMRHQHEVNWEQFASGGINSFVMDYLLAEVFSKQSPAHATLMMQTSILDRFCAPLCDAQCLMNKDGEGIEGKLNGEGFIEWLKQTNLFVIPLDMEKRWFRYHHLFQDILQRQLKRHCSAEDIAALHYRASKWFARENLIEEALKHALASYKPVAAAQIIEEHRYAVLNNDQTYILAKWLNMLPDEIALQRPQILLAKAWVAYEQLKLEKLPPLLGRCETLVGKKRKDRGLLGEINYYKVILAFFQGQINHTLEFIKKAQDWLPEQFELARADTEIFWGLSQQVMGKKEDAIQTLTTKIQSTPARTEMMISRQIATISFIHLIAGELEPSAQAAQQLRGVAQHREFIYTDLWGAYLQGSCNFQRFDLEAANIHLASVAEKKYLFHPRGVIDCLAGLAITHWAMQRTDESEITLQEQSFFAQQSGDLYNLVLANSCRARLALLRGDLESAGRWLQAFDETPNVFSMLFFMEIPCITECRVLVAIGSDSSLKVAAKKLELLWKDTKAIHNTFQMIEIAVLKALALQRQGQTNEALSALKSAVTLGKPGGWIRPFVEVGPQMADMVKALIKQNIEVNYLRQILAAFSNVGDKGQAQIRNPKSEIENPIIEPLTNREEEILNFLAQRLQNKEIAEKLCISTETVKTHLQNIFQKLNAGNRRKAVATAKTLGILSQS
jgi:LuxR family maltose regulon positive regulatory protein